MVDKYDISLFLDNVHKFCSFTFLELGFEGDFNGGASVSFTRARCGSKCIHDIKGVNNEGIEFVDVFPHGIDLLKTLKTGDKEACKQMSSHIRTAVNVLNQYFEEKDQHEKSLYKVLHQSNSELDITVAVAEHLLGKLAPGKSFEIDDKSKGKHVCKCGFEHCKKESKFGITGLGHEKVWHGFVDIIFGSHEGIEGESIATLCSPNQSESADVTPTKKQRADNKDEESSSNSPGGRSKKLPTSVGDQPIAETIVFSLLQKQRHPEFENHITPNIYIDRSNFRIFMYDADGDFLISTARIPLFSEETLRPLAIISLWMVLHYRIFCSKLQEGKRLKSRFRELVGEKWEIYSNNLKFHVSSFPSHGEASLPDIDDSLNFNRNEKE